MKQLTDTERLEVAMSLLDEHQVDEYANRCAELEHQPERNGSRNTPAECENRECKDCMPSDVVEGCPYWGNQK